MSLKDWYFIGFVLTIIGACILWVLAFIVYRNDRKEYLHRVLAWTMIFMGLWLLSGFAEKILPTPSNAFTLWTFRWAYASGVMTSTLFLLFALGLYLDRAPRKVFHRLIIAAGCCVAAFSLTPLVVKSASYSKGTLGSNTGSGFLLAASMIIIPSIVSIYLITKKWSSSSGIDRARTSIVLYGIIVFVPVFATSIFIVPAIVGNDVSSNYAFLAGLIPVGFTSYAVVRLRLLDTRIILRKTSVFLMGTLLLSVPIVILFFLFSATNLSNAAQYTALLLVFMVIIYFAQDAWKYFHRLSAHLFFSGLYDESELLEDVSSKLAAQTDPNAGLLAALSRVVYPLGLEDISIIIPPGVVNETCWSLECKQEADGSVSQCLNDNCNLLTWLRHVESTAVTEELLRWPRNQHEGRLGIDLAASGLSACLPMKVSKERIGYMLTGEKVAKKALSATDISFLEKAAEVFGLYIDNYALSTRLAFQLDELQNVYGDLHKAFDFKSEIIEVASHEFRTPITVINGFVQTLMINWEELTDEEKVECMASVASASKRLMNLTDKFLNISRIEAGDVSFVKVPMKLSSIVQDLCENLREEDLQRLIIEGNPELYVVSDPTHLEVMLEHLVENAFCFSPVDAVVILRVWRDSTTNYIQVQDFGKGIPVEEREKVFEPFVRLETLSHHSKGMGLGLHIVRLLSSRLGIEVEIESGGKSGTTVTLSFGLE